MNGIGWLLMVGAALGLMVLVAFIADRIRRRK